ncbi:MAG: cell division protein FtsQ/DivIB [Alphaproteobacteria bacterium]|nr:cell division protein FtsQ/DivIB [Alphaproteobacteria bacterium]
MLKKIYFWTAFVAVMFIAIYFVVRISMMALGMGPVRLAHSVSIITGTGLLGATEIAKVARIYPGTKMRDVDSARILSDIESVPAVRGASVRKLPGGRIMIKTEQRRVMATWTDGQVFYPISRDGHRIGAAGEYAVPGLLVFQGTLPTDIEYIVNTVGRYPFINSITHRLEWIESRRWNIHTTRGITIKLPELYMPTALRRLMAMHNQNQILDRQITILDLRDAERSLVELAR